MPLPIAVVRNKNAEKTETNIEHEHIKKKLIRKIHNKYPMPFFYSTFFSFHSSFHFGVFLPFV